MIVSRERLVLYGLMLAAVMLTGIGWLSGSAMFGNLFAEMVGLLLTVFVVDRLISMDSARTRRPATLAAFRDAVSICREAQDLITAAARSTIPASELDRVRSETGSAKAWLFPYLGSLTANKHAPWGAPPPYGTGMLNWAQALPNEIAVIKTAIDKYLARHTSTGDPEITEAVHDLEENGLFRLVGYGSLFWMIGDTQGGMWEHFSGKVEKLGGVLRGRAADFPEIDTQPCAFNWNLLVSEIEAAPSSDGKTTYRPD